MLARPEPGRARGNMPAFDAPVATNAFQALYEPLAEDDGMTLRVKTVPTRLRGNRELISQALANLVENAIKYGKPMPAAQPLSAGAVAGTESKVILIEARRDGDQVLLSVTDHGPGIPEADRKHAVERFVRLEASPTQPGSVLGLSRAPAAWPPHGAQCHLRVASGQVRLGLPERDAEAHRARLIDDTCRDVSAASSEADVMALLRRMKSEAALLIALCDIGGVWPVMRVTAALTDLAVASVQSALRYVLRQETARGRLLPHNPDSPERNIRLIVLAHG